MILLLIHLRNLMNDSFYLLFCYHEEFNGQDLNQILWKFLLQFYFASIEMVSVVPKRLYATFFGSWDRSSWFWLSDFNCSSERITSTEVCTSVVSLFWVKRKKHILGKIHLRKWSSECIHRKSSTSWTAVSSKCMNKEHGHDRNAVERKPDFWVQFEVERSLKISWRYK